MVEEPKPDVTKRTVNISSVKLSENILTDLVKIIDEHYQGSKNLDKYGKVIYDYENQTTGRKTSRVEAHNRDNFLSYRIVRTDLLRIQLRLDSTSLKIWILIIVNHGIIQIEVEGNDFTQVNGKTTRVEEIFDNPTVKTKNWLLHSKWSYFLWYPLGLLISIPSFYSLISYGLTVSLFISFLIAFMYSFLIANYFQWLYPKVEIEGTKQVRFRKLFLSLPGAVVVGVLVNIITDKISSLFSIK